MRIVALDIGRANRTSAISGHHFGARRQNSMTPTTWLSAFIRYETDVSQPPKSRWPHCPSNSARLSSIGVNTTILLSSCAWQSRLFQFNLRLNRPDNPFKGSFGRLIVSNPLHRPIRPARQTQVPVLDRPCVSPAPLRSPPRRWRCEQRHCVRSEARRGRRAG